MVRSGSVIACQSRSGAALMNAWYTCVVRSGFVVMRYLQRLLQPSQHRGGARGVLVDPAVVDEPDRYRVEKVQLLPSRPAGDDQSRVLQHPQVLHDTEPADLHLR